MLKEHSFFFLIILFSISLSCSVEENNVKNVLNDYINAKLSGNTQGAYQLLCEDDKEAIPYSRYKLENSITESPIVKVLRSDFKLTINNIEISDGKAKVTADLSIPDYTQILKLLIGAAFSSALDINDEKSAEKLIADYFSDKSIPRIN